jgi:aspartate aminotransferase-like enzyme
VNGAFSARFAAIASACDRDTDVLDVPFGGVHDLSAIDEALAARTFAAMTVVHSETSTGALTDIAALAGIAHRHGTMILVDSVSGVGGAPVETDAWQLDFVLTGSQKALALPPGLSFAVASERYLRHARTAPARGVYFDIVEMEEFARKNQTPSTPALSLLYAADVQLEAVRAEGIEARWARHAAMRESVIRWTLECEAAGSPVGILAPEGSRSPTVSAVTLPDGIMGDTVTKKVAERGFVVGSGYGPLRDRTFRIGHMGDHQLAGLARCLDACSRVLAELR